MKEIVIISIGIIIIINGILLMIRQLKALLNKKVSENWLDGDKKRNHPYNSKKVTINGKQYSSLTKAAEELGIHPATFNGWKNKYHYSDEVILEKIKDYSQTKRVRKPAIIKGYCFKNWKKAAEILGISASTLVGWRELGIIDRKIKENGIDFEEIVKKNNIPQLKKEEGKKKEIRRNKREINNLKFKISSSVPETSLKKYNLRIGDIYNVQTFLEHTGASRGLFYQWNEKKYIEMV